MQDWQDPHRTYEERLLAWVNDHGWGTGTALTILGSAISFLVKGELSPGAIAVALLVLTITVPPAAPNAARSPVWWG
jgi:hypothetical protein